MWLLQSVTERGAMLRTLVGRSTGKRVRADADGGLI